MAICVMRKINAFVGSGKLILGSPRTEDWLEFRALAFADLEDGCSQGVVFEVDVVPKHNVGPDLFDCAGITIL